MISKKIQKALQGSSAIRAMFVEGNELAAKVGRENVYDFSLGNPATPAPAALNEAIKELVDETDPLVLHGYMDNAGYPDVRQAIAENLNKRFGTIRMNEESRIEEFEEKPLQAKTNTISCGIYVVRRRLLIEMIEKCAEEDRYDFVRDILIRYKDLKRIYGYKIKDYWRNIASVDDYYSTNMDFLKADVRNYFFKQYPDVYSKVDDLPPAKYNPGSQVRNSLVSSGCIVNGVVENSVIFKKSYIGNNCVIKNSIILNDVYIGDNTHIENCIVESRDTIRANSYFVGEGEVKIVVERNERYVI